MENKIRIKKGKATANLEVVIFKDEATWIAWIPAFNVASEGDTPELAKNAVKEAGHVFLVDIIERKLLQKVLKELGCDELQGYHYSKAISKENFIEFIKSRN